jgi:hypothetical protein
MNIYKIPLLAILFLGLAVSGCTGVKTFTKSARPGETVAMGVGWHRDLNRNNLTVTITPSSGSPIIYAPGDPAVRAIFNLYPDPVSGLMVRQGSDLITQEQDFLELAVTDYDKEYFETVILIDLPLGIATGDATISMSSTTGENLRDTGVEILPGESTPNEFNNREGWYMWPEYVQSLERDPHYVVEFSASTIPYAMQIDIAHDPDEANGGTGIPHVVGSRSDIQNISWSDNGSNLKVILLPSDGNTLSNIKHFRFYITGELTGLLTPQVQAFDVSGNSVPGVTATVTAN